MEQTQKLTLQQRLDLFDFEKHAGELFALAPVGSELENAVDTLLTEKEKGLDE